MPLWWNPLICCPTAHYFPNDIWDATVKETERSISPAFQSNLLWEGNNMSIFEKKNGLAEPLSECGLGAWNHRGSWWHWESLSIFLQKETFPVRQLLWCFILFCSVFDWKFNIVFQDICFKNDLVEYHENKALRCKSTAIICVFSVHFDCSKCKLYAWK